MKSETEILWEMQDTEKDLENTGWERKVYSVWEYPDGRMLKVWIEFGEIQSELIGEVVLDDRSN